VQLFNLEVDPNEENNLAATYPKVLSYLQDRVSQLRAEDDLVDPCNIPGGTCADDDPNGEVVAEQHGAWFPWSADPAEKVLV
jgi:hypothetical protein